MLAAQQVQQLTLDHGGAAGQGADQLQAGADSSTPPEVTAEDVIATTSACTAEAGVDQPQSSGTEAPSVQAVGRSDFDFDRPGTSAEDANFAVSNSGAGQPPQSLVGAAREQAIDHSVQ